MKNSNQFDGVFQADAGRPNYPLSEVAPLAIDLFCGLGGWAEGFLAEGWDVIGFDIERHDYGTGGYPGQLVLQDVLSLHGSQFSNAAIIVASPPCQAYSYRAMPWKRAKALPPPDNTLFEACFRIQREASESAGRHIPLIVENVRGAQKWVGRARWNYGSYYLWGDIPALMLTAKSFKVPGFRFDHNGSFQSASVAQKFNPDGTAHGQGSWFKIADSKNRGVKNPGNPLSKIGFNVANAQRFRRERDSFGCDAGSPLRNNSSRSDSRKAASAQIAKIPFPLAQYIAQVFKPERDHPPEAFQIQPPRSTKR